MKHDRIINKLGDILTPVQENKAAYEKRVQDARNALAQAEATLNEIYEDEKAILGALDDLRKVNG